MSHPSLPEGLSEQLTISYQNVSILSKVGIERTKYWCLLKFLLGVANYIPLQY